MKRRMNALRPVYRLPLTAICLATLVMLSSWAGAQDFFVNNFGDNPDPYDPGTIYLGDTAVTFKCHSWGDIGGNWGGAQVWIDSDSTVQDGSAGADFNYTQFNEKLNTSAQFTSVGTWYWAILMRYNTATTTYGWYCYDTDGGWVGEQDPPSTSIPIAVNALNPPSNVTVTVLSDTSIRLNWEQGVSGVAKDTLIFRSLSSTPPHTRAKHPLPYGRRLRFRRPDLPLDL